MPEEILEIGGKRDLYEIGDRIREQREKKELSQEDLAERMGVSNQTISRLETGTSVAKIDTLLRLASALETVPGALLPKRFYQVSSQHLLDTFSHLFLELNEKNKKILYDSMIPFLRSLLENQRHQ